MQQSAKQKRQINSEHRLGSSRVIKATNANQSTKHPNKQSVNQSMNKK
jgi:hypothetical protein